MGVIDRYRYYFLRGGLNFVAARIKRNMGFSSEAQFRSTEAYARFCEYFTNLSPEDYAEELKTQFATILSKFPSKYKEKPETFCEKIQWLKVNEISTLKTILADKYLAREWVAEKIGGGAPDSLSGRAVEKR